MLTSLCHRLSLLFYNDYQITKELYVSCRLVGFKVILKSMHLTNLVFFCMKNRWYHVFTQNLNVKTFLNILINAKINSPKQFSAAMQNFWLYFNALSYASVTFWLVLCRDWLPNSKGFGITFNFKLPVASSFFCNAGVQDCWTLKGMSQSWRSQFPLPPQRGQGIEYFDSINTFISK